jgi:hypothetical protein
MRLRFGYLSLCLMLAACASDDTRYRDNSALEKPPTLAVEKREATVEAPEKVETEKTTEEAAAMSEEDQEETPPKAKKGLGDAVSISDRPSLVLTIKQSFDMAWNSLKQALVQSGIEVTDLEHDKGKFYVSYDADSYTSDHGSLIEKSVGLFDNDYDKQSYVLTVSAEDRITKVTAAPAKDAEYRKRTDRDDEEASADADSHVSNAAKPTDGAEKLLRSVYLTLKDDLREN